MYSCDVLKGNKRQWFQSNNLEVKSAKVLIISREFVDLVVGMGEKPNRSTIKDY